MPPSHALPASRWPIFESSVSRELLTHLGCFNAIQGFGQHSLTKLSANLPPKMVEIDYEDGGKPTAASEEPLLDSKGSTLAPRPAETRDERTERVCQMIGGATFTRPNDREALPKLYRGTVTRLVKVMAGWGDAVVDSVYEGERDAKGKPEGKGTLRFSEGTVYEGQWRGGKQDGYGTLRRASGEVYEGEYKNGQRTGRGKLRYPDGASYDGQWKQGAMEGEGTYTFTDGSTYSGEWKGGERTGKGTMRWSDGEIEVGRYVEGEQMGEGMRWAEHWKGPKRVRDGQVAELISMEEARKVAERVGVPMPPIRSRVEP